MNEMEEILTDELKLTATDSKMLKNDPEWLRKRELKRLHLILGDERIPIISDFLRGVITMEELKKKLAELGETKE